ncbi:MAG TPA: ABC transporter permease [Bryobacteraceae bacterium]|nr:ABC transporter permease [Bryobacteraceae bacterium]
MRPAEIATLSAEHLWLVAVAIFAALVIAAPSAVLLTRRARLRRWTLGVVNVIQTVPSLAVFGFLLPLPLLGGVGKQTAIVALTLYALLPILRNMVVGILGVDPGVRESAVAMGMTSREILWGVELPLAFPTVLAGIRIATVTTIGTATIAAAIGGGGLGTFVFRGIAMADTRTILAGAVPAALMAIVADEVLGWIERRFSS